jgi:nickel/cobalt transporter (NicO) family protein
MRRVLAALGLATLAIALPTAVLAHPLGNFSINHYAGIRVSPAAVEVDLVIEMAEIPALEAIAALDADGDGTADPAELDAARADACARLAGGLSLGLDRTALDLELTAAGMQTARGAGGLSTLRTVCELRASLPAPIETRAELHFSDASHAERIGWREIVVRGDGVSVVGAPTAGVSDRLTAYPDDLLQQPLDQRAVTVTLAPGGDSSAAWTAPDAWPLDGRSGVPGGSQTSVPGGVGDELAAIPLQDATLPVMLGGLLVAMLAGAGHALGPGHGKTVMAAYLVGSGGTARRAVLLGAAVTVSHTLGVLLLAAIVLVAGSVVPPDRLYPILTVVSGSIVIVIGSLLLAGCVRRALGRRSHAVATVSDHQHHGMHRHGWRVHSHAHDSAPGPVLGWRGLLAIGIAGGLVPSTSALILLLGAIGAGAPAYGVVLAMAFGIGMATVLAGIGLALVRGRDWVGRIGPGWPAARGLASLLPWATAVVVLAAGLVVTGQTLAMPL